MTARPRTRSAFVVGTATALASLALVKAPAKSAQFEFKCASDQALTHPSSVRLMQMWAAIEQETGGRFHTQLFPSSQLGGDSSMLTQARTGAIQFYLCSPSILASVVPAADISNIGFAFKDQDEILRVMDGALGDYVRQESAAKDFYVLRRPWTSGMYQIGSNSHPIRTVDDLNGFKIRVPEGRIMVDLFKTLGASPLAISFNEVYPGLQTKLIDGETIPLVTFESSKLYEVSKYVSMTNNAAAAPWLITSAATWNSVPADIKDVVERNHAKFVALERQDVKTGDLSAGDRLTQKGMIFNQIDQTPFRARLRPYFQSWQSTFGSKAWTLLESSLRKKLT